MAARWSATSGRNFAVSYCWRMHVRVRLNNVSYWTYAGCIPVGVTWIFRGEPVQVKGAKGELARTFDPDMRSTIEDSQVLVQSTD